MGSNSTRTLQKLACAGACDDDFHELAYGPGTVIWQSSRNKKATGVAQVSTMTGPESSLYWSMCWQEREKYAEFVTTTNNEAVMVGEVIGTGHILKEQKSDLMWPDWLPFNSWNLFSKCEYGAAESGLSKYKQESSHWTLIFNGSFQLCIDLGM